MHGLLHLSAPDFPSVELVITSPLTRAMQVALGYLESFLDAYADAPRV